MKRESQKQLPFASVSVLSTENKGELIFFFFLVLNNTLKKQSLLQTRLSPISFRLAPNKILRTVFSCLSSLKLLQITHHLLPVVMCEIPSSTEAVLMGSLAEDTLVAEHQEAY